MKADSPFYCKKGVYKLKNVENLGKNNFFMVWQGFFILVYPYILFVRKVSSSLDFNIFSEEDYALWNVNKTIKRYVDNNS